MDVSSVQPVTKVSTSGGVSGALNADSSFSLQGEGMGVFDLMFQNMIMGQPEMMNPQGQEGTFTFDFALFESMELPELSADGEMSFLFDVEELTQLFEEFGFFDQEGLAQLPTVFQEIQMALNDASALGQSQVDLTSIIEGASLQEKKGFLGLMQQQQSILSSNQSARELLGSIGRSVLQQENPEAVLTKSVVDKEVANLSEENPFEFTQTQADQLKQILNQGAQRPASGEIETKPVFNSEDVIPEESMGDKFMKEDGLHIPDYMNPDAYEGIEIEEFQPVGKKESLDLASKSIQSGSGNSRTDSSVLNSVNLSDSFHSDNGNSKMRNSLNLSLQNQATDEIAIEGEEITEVESASLRFEDNLKKLQDTQAVIKQISKNVAIRQGVANQEINIKLEPAYLGEVQVKVQMEEGRVSVKMVVNNAQVKDMLESNLSALKNSIEKSSMEISQLDVSLNDEANDGFAASGGLENNQAKQSSKSSESVDSFDKYMKGDAGPFFDVGGGQVTNLMDRLHQVNFLA